MERAESTMIVDRGMYKCGTGDGKASSEAAEMLINPRKC